MWIKSQNRDESESNYETNLEKLKRTDRTSQSGLVRIELPNGNSTQGPELNWQFKIMPSSESHELLIRNFDCVDTEMGFVMPPDGQ